MCVMLMKSGGLEYVYLRHYCTRQMVFGKMAKYKSSDIDRKTRILDPNGTGIAFIAPHKANNSISNKETFIQLKKYIVISLYICLCVFVCVNKYIYNFSESIYIYIYI